MQADLGVYTHRWSDHLPELLESIGDTVQETNYNVITHIQPGSVHLNMKRVLQRRISRYFAFLDEDIVFRQPGWLEALLEHFEDPEVGAVTCAQDKNSPWNIPEQDPRQHSREENTDTLLWAPGHVVLVDFDRVSPVPDEGIPGVKGMSDVDFCLQITAGGYKLNYDRRVCVYHPHKPEASLDRELDENPTIEEELEVFPKQVAYMVSKWGQHYSDLFAGFAGQFRETVREEFDRQGISWPGNWRR